MKTARVHDLWKKIETFADHRVYIERAGDLIEVKSINYHKGPYAHAELEGGLRTCLHVNAQILIK